MPITLPHPEKEKRLGLIQRHLFEHKEEKSVRAISKAVELMLKEESFQRHVAQSKDLSNGVKSEVDLIKFSWAFLLHYLYARDPVSASMILWDQNTFCAKPRCVQTIWSALMENRMVCLIGGGGMSKTYSPSAYFLLQYILDPEYTRVQVASASHDHLMGNLFRDIGALHSDASLVLPGKHENDSISLDKKRRQGIFTLTLPQGSNGKSKIKGSHTKPRPFHPLFGLRSRLFCIIDESQEIPEGAFDEIPNRFSTVAPNDVEHLKFSLSANPRDIFSKFGQILKPVGGGWSAITRNTLTWQSTHGWFVVSLDQTQHENYIARKQVYAGFATYDGVMDRLKACNGDWEDPRMFTYVFGKFPPQGTTFAVISQKMILESEGEWVFKDRVVALAGMDPAFTSDRPAFASGRAGLAIGWTDSTGEQHMLEKPRMAIQLDNVIVLPRGEINDSQSLADEAMSRLRDLGVQPLGFAIDQTGVGRGAADIIRRQWAQKVSPIAPDSPDGIAAIHGMEFGSSPSQVKIAEEDSQTPRERFDRIATEIWYAAAKLFELDTIRIGKAVDLKVMSELASRKGDMQRGAGKKLTVESKDEYKRRTNGDSPDLADAALIMVHAARMSIAGIIPKARDTIDIAEPAAPGWLGWGQSFAAAPMEGMAGAGEMADLMKD